MTEPSFPQDDSSSIDDARRVSGRLVVISMFAFGLLVTGALWLYWELYTRPFRQLQEAIVREMPNSNPRVIGGRQKSHEAGNPATLRVVIRVKFNPQEEEAQAQQLARRLAQLIADHHDLSTYQVLEIHLYESLPEEELHLWSQAKPISEWNLRAPSS